MTHLEPRDGFDHLEEMAYFEAAEAATDYDGVDGDYLDYDEYLDDDWDGSRDDFDDYYYDDSMDGDHESGLASAGWGTDEDYGYYGGDEDW